jgi:hypothetical protein
MSRGGNRKQTVTIHKVEMMGAKKNAPPVQGANGASLSAETMANHGRQRPKSSRNTLTSCDGESWRAYDASCVRSSGDPYLSFLCPRRLSTLGCSLAVTPLADCRFEANLEFNTAFWRGARVRAPILSHATPGDSPPSYQLQECCVTAESWVPRDGSPLSSEGIRPAVTPIPSFDSVLGPIVQFASDCVLYQCQ